MQVWINIANLVTAAAALLVILEMRWQRHSSYKPDLLIGTVNFIAYRQRSGHHVLTIERRLSPEEAIDPFHRTAVLCTNVGTGPAKNVTCEWRYDLLAFVELIGRMNPVVAESLKVDEKWFSVGRGAGSFSYTIPEGSQVIAFIPSGDRGAASLWFPQVFVALLGVYLETRRSVRDDAILREVPDPLGLTLALRYEDLGGSHHTRRFTLTPRLQAYLGPATDAAEPDTESDDPGFEIAALGSFQVTAA